MDKEMNVTCLINCYLILFDSRDKLVVNAVSLALMLVNEFISSHLTPPLCLLYFHPWGTHLADRRG